jgi:IclR family transcriptional regulator, acetate operon repressor
MFHDAEANKGGTLMARRSGAAKAKNSTKDSKIGGVRAVERAIDILEAFSNDRPSMSVLDIQKQLGLSRPTLYRLLETLAARGFIRVRGTPQRFSLDYGVQKLAQAWLAGLDPVTAAQPILARLHGETQETVGLVIAREQQSLWVLELPSPHILSVSRGVGLAGHVARGATGKAILAFMDDKAAEAVLATLPNDVDKASLLADLAKVRRDGFRISRSEILAGAVALAAPFFDHTGRVVGSMGVLAPEIRATDTWVARTKAQLLAAAAELSAALGHAETTRGKPQSARPR